MNMNHFSYIPLLTVLATLTACESSDMPIQHADSYGYITFSASTEKTISRSNNYENYDPTKHPDNMGVFETTIFQNGNEKASYNTTTGSWETNPAKKWDDYIRTKSFDFFAYMPKVEGAKVELSSSDKTLSFPFTMNDAPLIYDVKSAPLICTLPEHKEGTDAEGKEFTFDRVVRLQFDQTLTGYKLLFKLDTKMGAIRQFRLKKVTLSGELATGCTIARTYTYDTSSKSWTAGSIDWKDIQRKTFNNFQLSNQEAVIIKTSDYTQWGETFYTIPDSNFSPTLKATYDVEFLDQDGKTVVTRKDVTSTIVINKTNFNELVTTQTATIFPIRILIQPRYLYVLSDQDAYTGHLLVE